MRRLVALGWLVIVAASVTEIPETQVTEVCQQIRRILGSWQKIATPVMDECFSEVGGDSNQLQAFYKNATLGTDTKFLCASKCVLQKLHYVTPDGKYNITYAEQQTPGVTGFFENCENIIMDPCEKVYDLGACFLKNVKAALNSVTLNCKW